MELLQQMIIMKIFLICNEEGGVIDVISSKTFEEAYADAIALNKGSLLVEIDNQTLKKMDDLKDEISI